jgi:hypothetical protein
VSWMNTMGASGQIQDFRIAGVSLFAWTRLFARWSIHRLDITAPCFAQMCKHGPGACAKLRLSPPHLYISTFGVDRSFNIFESQARRLQGNAQSDIVY